MGTLAYLLLSWGAITAVLIVLVIYRAILSGREDDQLYLNRAEVNMMASENESIIHQMDRMRFSIITLAVLSGVLLIATAAVWLWTGLQSF